MRLLADWGAEVIRVEPPGESDAQDVTGHWNSPDSQNLHRNKKGITLNLKDPRGYEVLKTLVATADVLVENFKTDVKHRLKIDYESLKPINPRLIVASISGFGQTGPYATRPGFDQIIQGMSGLMSLTGVPDGEPMRAGIAVSDTSAGMFLGQGILLALIERERTGQGQWVHTSLLEAMLSKLDFQAARYTMAGEVPGREGNHHPTAAPMGVFKASDGHVNLAATTGRMWRDFCHALGLEHLLDDSRFSSNGQRVANRQLLINEIEKRRCSSHRNLSSKSSMRLVVPVDRSTQWVRRLTTHRLRRSECVCPPTIQCLARWIWFDRPSIYPITQRRIAAPVRCLVEVNTQAMSSNRLGCLPKILNCSKVKASFDGMYCVLERPFL